MVHGSPRSIVEFLYEDEPAKKVLSLMKGCGIDLLFCAHTHLPYYRIIGTKHIINPGSVGRPRNKKPQASYALVELDDKIRADIRYVDYDYEKHAKEIEESELPNEFANQIREGFW